MTPLERLALLRNTLSREQVETIYEGNRVKIPRNATVSSLCESHERLRMELSGAEIVITQWRSDIGNLLSWLMTCRQDNTDEWMEGLVDRINLLLMDIDDEDRVRYVAGFIEKIER